MIYNTQYIIKRIKVTLLAPNQVKFVIRLQLALHLDEHLKQGGPLPKPIVFCPLPEAGFLLSTQCTSWTA